MSSFYVTISMLLQAAPAVDAISESDLDLEALLAQEQPQQPAVSDKQNMLAAVAQLIEVPVQEVRSTARAKSLTRQKLRAAIQPLLCDCNNVQTSWLILVCTCAASIPALRSYLILTTSNIVASEALLVGLTSEPWC